eukprot:6212004-Pleurochrysis_carterae.AAC.4
MGTTQNTRQLLWTEEIIRRVCAPSRSRGSESFLSVDCRHNMYNCSALAAEVPLTNQFPTKHKEGVFRPTHPKRSKIDQIACSSTVGCVCASRDLPASASAFAVILAAGTTARRSASSVSRVAASRGDGDGSSTVHACTIRFGS